MLPCLCKRLQVQSASTLDGEKADRKNSNMSHLSVAMTTTEETGITDGDAITLGASRGIKFYFQLFVVITGVIGTAANGLVLYALVASKQHKKHVLIVNQNVLDLFSCFFLVTIYSVHLCNVYLTGSTGYWLCMLILSDTLIWWGVNGSIINLAVISVERYLKVVHPVWSKNLRRWMIYSAMAFAWIASIVYNLAVVFPTTIVLDGECYVSVFFTSKSAQMVHFFWDFLSFYIMILLIFIFCYGRILAAVRRQARVMAGHNAAGSNTAPQAQSNHIHTNVIKTMMLVCAFYAISWLPMNTVILLWSFAPHLHQQLDTAYYISMFLEVLYICTNPFIYAAKFHPVRQVLIGMITCKKTTEQASGYVP